MVNLAWCAIGSDSHIGTYRTRPGTGGASYHRENHSTGAHQRHEVGQFNRPKRGERFSLAQRPV